MPRFEKNPILRQPPNIVNTVKKKKQSLVTFFIGCPMKKVTIYTYPRVHGQRRGHHVTTVDQSDMRGLGTE